MALTLNSRSATLSCGLPTFNFSGLRTSMPSLGLYSPIPVLLLLLLMLLLLLLRTTALAVVVAAPSSVSVDLDGHNEEKSRLDSSDSGVKESALIDMRSCVRPNVEHVWRNDDWQRPLRRGGSGGGGVATNKASTVGAASFQRRHHHNNNVHPSNKKRSGAWNTRIVLSGERASRSCSRCCSRRRACGGEPSQLHCADGDGNHHRTSSSAAAAAFPPPPPSRRRLMLFHRTNNNNYTLHKVSLVTNASCIQRQRLPKKISRSEFPFVLVGERTIWLQGHNDVIDKIIAPGEPIMVSSTVSHWTVLVPSLRVAAHHQRSQWHMAPPHHPTMCAALAC
jgi:hypothetical protein